MHLCKVDQAVLAAYEAGRDWRDVVGIRGSRRFLRVLSRARWRRAHAPAEQRAASIGPTPSDMPALPVLGRPNPMTLRKWSRLAWRDARADLVALGQLAAKLAKQGIVATHDDLRQRGLHWYKYVEQKQAMLFAHFLSVARLNGAPIGYAMLEDEDYDCVLQYRVGNKRGFSCVQLKEVVPPELNPNATIETELAKLGKYVTSGKTIAAVHINRQEPIVWSALSKPNTSLAEVWLYGALRPDQSLWFLYGDLLRSPRGYEVAWPTRVR